MAASLSGICNTTLHALSCDGNADLEGRRVRLTSFTDYGLRMLMRLAGAPERSFTTEALAREFAISRHHLQKVVQELGRAGYVATQRGAGGGFRLAVPPGG